MAKRTSKGIFLKNAVKIIEKEKGPEGLKQLEKEFGDFKFSAFKNYPMEENVRFNKAAVKVLYGEVTSDAWRKFGGLAFHTYVDSVVGRTMMSLLGNDLEKVIFALEKVLGTVSAGYEMEVEKLNDNKFKIRFFNNPDEIEFYEGVFVAGIKYFGYKPKVSSKAFGKENFEYVLEWE